MQDDNATDGLGDEPEKWVGLVMVVGGVMGACVCAWKMAPVASDPCRCGGPPHATWCTEEPGDG